MFNVVECRNWTYGNNCVHNCSGNCLNDSTCNKQTGHCDRGCKPGYTNALCNKRKWKYYKWSWINYIFKGFFSFYVLIFVFLTNNVLILRHTWRPISSYPHKLWSAQYVSRWCDMCIRSTICAVTASMYYRQ